VLAPIDSKGAAVLTGLFLAQVEFFTPGTHLYSMANCDQRVKSHVSLRSLCARQALKPHVFVLK